MISSAEYIIQGKSYVLAPDGTGRFAFSGQAPSLAGVYDIQIVLTDHVGNRKVVDGDSKEYGKYLQLYVLAGSGGERLMKYLPGYWRSIREMEEICLVESGMLDMLDICMEKSCRNTMVETMDVSSLSQLEKWLGTQGQGSVEQRRNYLLAMRLPGRKLNKSKIEHIIKQITGGRCEVSFQPAVARGGGQDRRAVLKVVVLSPDNNKDYRLADIYRAVSPLVPAHIDFAVERKFFTWGDLSRSYNNWQKLWEMKDWQEVNDFTMGEMLHGSSNT